MLHYQVLQSHWLLLSIFGSMILMVSLVLTYMAIWRPRSGDEGTVVPGSEGISDRWYHYIPWIIVLTYAAVFGFAVTYSVVYMVYLMNI